MKIFIKDYEPYKGFYDLRERNLPIKIFKKLWKAQDMLYHYSIHADYFKKYHPTMWEKAKELSAIYQQVLFSYNRKRGNR